MCSSCCWEHVSSGNGESRLWPVTVCIDVFMSVPVGCTIILGVTIVIPVCMIVFGTLYMSDCPQGEYIPVYLLVGGECSRCLLIF